jgi:hypothetical protein
MSFYASRFSLLLIICAACLCMGRPAAAADSAFAQVSLCVLPVKAIGVSENEAMLISGELARKLSQNEQLAIVDKNKAAQALKDMKPDAGSECTGAECVCSVGEKCQSSFAMSSSIGKVGTLFTYSVALYSVKEKKRILLRDYQYKGSIEDFYSEVPRRIADDILALLFPSPKAAETHLAVTRAFATETPVVLDTAAQQPEERVGEKQKAAEQASNIGIVAGPTIGIMARVALGTIKTDQSQWGASLWYVHPTSPHSQARIKLGFPLSGNDSVNKSINLKYPDLYVSLEHEWGFRYFGIGIGLALMQMKAFTMLVPYSQFWDPGPPGRYVTDYSPVHFSDQYCANWVFTLRGGKPNMGFMGRISWPTPVNQDMTWAANSFLEYSALGVFGNNVFKGGIGVAGMQKYRSSVETENIYSTTHYTLNNSYCMAPCGKCAVLIGKQSVLCASVDLTGILFPRTDSGGWWAPSIQLDYTISFAPLKGPEVLDGSF